MKIANIEIPGKAVLAPLAGITDLPFRLICKELGASLVYTEMISSEGLIRRQPATVSVIESAEKERPVSFQIFGSKPDSMARAAAMLADKGADIIDINMGCPVKKVIRNRSGAALMRDIEAAERMVKAVVAASSVPVTVKIRTGWTAAEFVAVEFAKAFEAAGAAAIAVHGRNAKQGFSGVADWTAIKAVKDAVSIPVIGNGDVTDAASAKRMIDETGCDSVMIGRGALGNPWIFRDINQYLSDGTMPEPPTPAERGEMLLRHMRAVVARHVMPYGIHAMRKHAAWYSKGLDGAAEFRRRIFTAETMTEFEGSVEDFFAVSSFKA